MRSLQNRRLINPGLDVPDILELEEKLNKALGILAHNPKNGGNPFLSALCVGKQHILTNDIRTAATDSKRYFWCPQRIRELKPRQLLITLKHEALHVALRHCTPDRFGDRIQILWNWAVDWVVNGMIEHEHNTLKSPTENHPIWQGNLGIRCTLEDFKNGMLGNLPQHLLKKNIRPADPELYGRSADSIYREIIDFFKDNNIPLKIDLDVLYDDEHMKFDCDEQSLAQHILSAMATAKALRGVVPGEIEASIQNLYDPQTDLMSYMEQFIAGKKEGGLRRSYTAYRRRFIHRGMYLPKYMQMVGRVVVLLDTSGSMMQEDIDLAVSQLASFNRSVEVVVIPVDAVPHWDSATILNGPNDIPKIKVVGRGGTVFREFFEQYKTKLTGRFNLVVVLTDGGCDTIPPELEPPCPTLWVLTRECPGFKPEFGRVIRLENYHLAKES